MARLALVALALGLVAAEPNPLIEVRPTVNFKQLAVGIASGFISDKQVLMMCAMGAADEVAQFKIALVNLEKAVTTMPVNITKIEMAVDGVEEAAQAIPIFSDACKPLGAALQDLHRAFRRLHGPPNTMVDVLDHLVDGGDMIYAELAEADKYYKSGLNYISAGENLGMAFRRMLVGELNSSSVPHDVSPACGDDIAEGMGVGFLSDSLEFANCSMHMKADEKDAFYAFLKLQDALVHMDGERIEKAVEGLDSVMEKAMGTKQECKDAIDAAEDNMYEIQKELKGLHGPGDLAMHMLHNLMTDNQNISAELAKAAEAHKKRDCMAAGREMGMAFRRTLVGETHARMTDSLVLV
jgi:hypothetical protein